MCVGRWLDGVAAWLWRRYDRCGYRPIFELAWVCEFVAYLLLDYVSFVRELR